MKKKRNAINQCQFNEILFLVQLILKIYLKLILIPFQITLYIRQLLKKYNSIDSFPIYNFIPIWKAASSTSYKKYENKENFIIDGNHMTVVNDLDVDLLIAIKIQSAKYFSCILKISDNEDFSNATEKK